MHLVKMLYLQIGSEKKTMMKLLSLNCILMAKGESMQKDQSNFQKQIFTAQSLTTTTKCMQKIVTTYLLLNNIWKDF